ncbi:MAG: hypothetical protein RID91_19545 [Azospirillaceae bacterium]
MPDSLPMTDLPDETTPSDELPDAITVLADEFTPAAMEYHRREMGKRGYQLAGPILPRVFYHLDGPGAPDALFEGKAKYAATFVRTGKKPG